MPFRQAALRLGRRKLRKAGFVIIPNAIRRREFFLPADGVLRLSLVNACPPDARVFACGPSLLLLAIFRSCLPLESRVPVAPRKTLSQKN